MKVLLGKEKNIQLFVEKDYEAMSQKAAGLLVASISAKLQEKEFVTFMPSAGGTPIRLYQILGEMHKNSLDWSRVVVLQMDEYFGLPAFHKNSYALFLRERLLLPLEISRAFFIAEYVGKNGGESYEQVIENMGGVDIILHGIGENGHLGFNEPGSGFDSVARVVDLTPETIRANARFFSSGDDVPTRGITIGLRTIMQAGVNILIASGPKKHSAINRLLFESMQEDMPASILQNHPNVLVIVDEDVRLSFRKSSNL